MADRPARKALERIEPREVMEAQAVTVPPEIDAIGTHLGHSVERDTTQPLSRVRRYTCTSCGRSVLDDGTKVYGTATTETCRPQNSSIAPGLHLVQAPAAATPREPLHAVLAAHVDAGHLAWLLAPAWPQADAGALIPSDAWAPVYDAAHAVDAVVAQLQQTAALIQHRLRSRTRRLAPVLTIVDVPKATHALTRRAVADPLFDVARWGQTTNVSVVVVLQRLDRVPLELAKLAALSTLTPSAASPLRPQRLRLVVPDA